MENKKLVSLPAILINVLMFSSIPTGTGTTQEILGGAASTMIKQLQQPAKLETLATNKIVKWIMWKVTTQWNVVRILGGFDVLEESDKMSLKIATARNYFKKNSGIVLNNLLAESMAHISNIPPFNLDNPLHGVMSRMLKQLNPSPRWIEVFFTDYITNLSLNSHTFDVFLESFRYKSQLLTDLTTLNIHINSFPERNEQNVLCNFYRDFFKNVPNIKHLKITCPTDNILRSVLNDCKSIVKLDLYEYYNTTIETFAIITQLPNIEKVYLHDSSLNSRFGLVSIEKQKKSIWEYISKQNQFEIKSFVITNATSTDDLLLFKKYPNIQTLEYFVTVINPRPQLCLENLNCLQDLRVLKIYNIFDDQVKNLIQLVGRKLLTLHILDVAKLDLQALKFIGQTCPSLKNMTISAKTFSTDELLSKKQNHPWSKKDVDTSAYKQLRTLNMSLKCGNKKVNNSSQPSPGQLLAFFILENCRNVESIDLCKMDLTKDFLLEVLKKNPLKCITELRMPQKLDQLVLDRILKNNVAPVVEFLGK